MCARAQEIREYEHDQLSPSASLRLFRFVGKNQGGCGRLHAGEPTFTRARAVGFGVSLHHLNARRGTLAVNRIVSRCTWSENSGCDFPNRIGVGLCAALPEFYHSVT